MSSHLPLHLVLTFPFFALIANLDRRRSSSSNFHNHNRDLRWERRTTRRQHTRHNILLPIHLTQTHIPLHPSRAFEPCFRVRDELKAIRQSGRSGLIVHFRPVDQGSGKTGRICWFCNLSTYIYVSSFTLIVAAGGRRRSWRRDELIKSPPLTKSLTPNP